MFEPTIPLPHYYPEDSDSAAARAARNPYAGPRGLSLSRINEMKRDRLRELQGKPRPWDDPLLRELEEEALARSDEPESPEHY